MKKHTLLAILLFLVVGKMNAQKIGVNTVLPLSDLHIHGKLQVTKDLNFGGTATTKGDSGEKGQVLKSNGEGKAPEWSTLTIPIIDPGAYAMTNTNVYVDHIGIELKEGTPDKRAYQLDEDINTKVNNEPNAIWIPFKELEADIVVNNSKNKVNLTLQTIGSITPTSSSLSTFTYAIGFFINDKLKSVKPFKVEGYKDTIEVSTLVSTINDLPIGTHKLKVAIITRLKSSNYSGVLAIGQPNSKKPDLVSEFMARTSLKIDVFEVLEESKN